MTTGKGRRRVEGMVKMREKRGARRREEVENEVLDER
jgi:hypothetical protein